MSLRDDLKLYIPMYLWEVINHPEGYTMTNEEFNARWNMLQEQGDQQADAIRDLLLMLYETLLSDTDGTAHINVDLPEYDVDNLRALLLLIDQRIKADIAALVEHKSSANHDSRYYTKTLLNEGQLDTRYYTETELNANKLGTLYYTKGELLPFLRGGDTLIREETFIITSADNGNGTFTCEYSDDEFIFALGESGEQIFEMQTGVYNQDSNAIEAIVNDTLRRSVASGGLAEIDGYAIALTSPEGVGAEITFKYYERLGLAGEYNIRLSETPPPFNNGKTLWYQVLGEYEIEALELR